MSSISTRAGALCMCVTALLPWFGQAHIGLRGSTQVDRISLKVVEDSFLSELAGTLGQASKARINWIETQLRPMFTALPKSSDGTLTQAVARYALHRFFAQQHGWHVNGLEPSTNSWNASSATDILKDRVPSHVLALAEEHLGGRGCGLHELAVLVATLDDLVHSESVERLMKAYAAHGVPTQSSMTKEMVDLMLQRYMFLTLLPRASKKYSNLTSSQFLSILPSLPKLYPNWEDTILWMRDVQMGLDFAARMERNPFQHGETQEIDFAYVVRVVEEIGAQFGRFQDLECRSMKWTMLEIEDGESGRMSLSNFHQNALNGGWSKEGADYLREVGALDESDPERPTVVIPNYLGIRSMCLATSSFYSVCCIDECETLMMQLENKIASPSGAPQEISGLISTLSSDTVDVPRNLSETLLGRLNDIAAQHGGKVPLHGRLFAQWMHHAYPRECPYPQAPSVSNVPQTPAEENAMGSYLASKEEIERNAIMVGGGSSDASAAQELPWSDEEELVMVFEPTIGNRWWMWNSIRNFACLALVLSFLVDFRRTSRKVSSGLPLFGGGRALAEKRNSYFV